MKSACSWKWQRIVNTTLYSIASLMLKQGIRQKIVQERLGHSSIEMTLDIYNHVAPGIQETAAKRFDEVLGVSKPLSTLDIEEVKG